MWREQAITECLWRMISIVAFWHSAKLCAHPARAVWSQQCQSYGQKTGNKSAREFLYKSAREF